MTNGGRREGEEEGEEEDGRLGDVNESDMDPSD